jgi:hypothetical protein
VALRRADQRDHPADAHSLTHNLEYQSNPEADMGFGRGILLWMIGMVPSREWLELKVA